MKYIVFVRWNTPRYRHRRFVAGGFKRFRGRKRWNAYFSTFGETVYTTKKLANEGTEDQAGTARSYKLYPGIEELGEQTVLLVIDGDLRLPGAGMQYLGEMGIKDKFVSSSQRMMSLVISQSQVIEALRRLRQREEAIMIGINLTLAALSMPEVNVLCGA